MVEETKQNIIESGRVGWIAFWESLLGSVYLQMAIGGEKPNLSFLFKNIVFLMKNAPHAARKAETHFNNAIKHAKGVGANGTLGQTCLNLGLLHQARKRVGKAEECLSEAVRIFEETEAQVYLKQAREAMESLL